MRRFLRKAWARSIRLAPPLRRPTEGQRARSRPGHTPGCPMVGKRDDRQAERHVRNPPREDLRMNAKTIVKSGESRARAARSSVTAPAVVLRDVRKVHGQGGASVVALDGVSIALATGTFTAIMGPSGSGKSTFLHVAAGLDRPTSGSVRLGDTNLDKLSERRLTILRRERSGFAF